MIIIAENSAVKKFFRANARFESLIKANITTTLPEIISERPYKIKTCSGYKYQGQSIYEYKIPLDQNTDCRVAYIRQGEDIVVFFLSNTIIKEQFVKLLAKQKGVSKA